MTLSAPGLTLTDGHHSLMHAMGAANCDTPWEQLEGEGAVRRCPSCKKMAVETANLDQESIAKLVEEAEPSRPLNEVTLYRRKDGRLMTGKSYCNLAAFVDRVYSWPLVGVLVVAFMTMSYIGTKDPQQGYVVVFAMNVSYGLFIFLECAIKLFGIDFSEKGKMLAIRIWLGTVSTTAMTLYVLLRVLNVPIWSVDKGILVNFYLFGFVVCALLRFLISDHIEKRAKRIALK